MLALLQAEPRVKVGLLTRATQVGFALAGACLATNGHRFSKGEYLATVESDGSIAITAAQGGVVRFAPATDIELTCAQAAAFTLRGVTIGIDFHWQQQEDQTFTGALLLHTDSQGRLTVINRVPVEEYVTSVIASEMSATAHPELLKAHAIISRSWLLAQLAPWKNARANAGQIQTAEEIVRWYDRENHTGFDICADDHCQRYQGVTKVTAANVFEAINATRGRVLAYAGELCDARFSKSCGGFTELFSTAWEDADVPYLQAFYDGETLPADGRLPLSDEANAAAWIQQTPPAFCNAPEPAILTKILPNFDQATTDFYRWQVTLEQAELQALLERKLGLSFGAIHALEPVERGASGRLKRLRIAGAQRTLIIGKELEIRRALSPSHLYSSAFVIEPGAVQNGVPARFTLRGAGWGHGVGLCQIGAALMAEQGYDAAQILQHYYRGTQLFELYRGAS
ncbi:MAG: SpoIID/LytB domain-containing protein [Acidobacteria bacterium]|nr:SpoIID/LytB domain-containing protein [Acidobacteriota bacterium]MBI3427564.1 SpoIID/LytB domain-containing protein [Acidobacteriota bacterium]